MESPSRRQLENIWRERTEVAAEDYRNAKDVTAMVRLDTCHGLMPSVDGNYAYLLALRRETESLAKYKHVLEVFNGLVLYFKMPPDEHDENKGGC